MFVLSDHKPVSAEFSSGIRVVDAIRRKEVYQEVMKQLDKMENDFLPQVTVDEHNFNFGVVHFYEKKVLPVTITNTGPVIVKFLFKQKPKTKAYAKPWLKADPPHGTLKKGESCEVNLEVLVDCSCAHLLNSGEEEKASDVLVLHLEEGKDIFIAVDMDYQRSCFGCSLEALVRIATPISQVSAEQLKNIERDPQKYGEFEVPFEVPKELWVLFDVLQKHSLKLNGLFQKSGTAAEIRQIRESLDTKIPDGQLEGSAYSVAECLLLFLSSLREPVIPFCFYKKCIESSATYTQAKEVIKELPKVHQDTFRYVVLFLQELLKHSQENRLNVNIAATIFSQVMIRSPREVTSPAIDRARCTFLYHFLMNPCE